MCAPDTARTAKRDELDSQSSGPSDKLIKTERTDPTFLLLHEQGTPAIVSHIHTSIFMIKIHITARKKASTRDNTQKLYYTH